MTLETTNPHCFTYKTDELLIELLGGIRIDTLDRMRVTMKVTIVSRKHAEYLNNAGLAGLSVRHNLDHVVLNFPVLSLHNSFCYIN